MFMWCSVYILLVHSRSFDVQQMNDAHAFNALLLCPLHLCIHWGHLLFWKWCAIYTLIFRAYEHRNMFIVDSDSFLNCENMHRSIGSAQLVIKVIIDVKCVWSLAYQKIFVIAIKFSLAILFSLQCNHGQSLQPMIMTLNGYIFYSYSFRLSQKATQNKFRFESEFKGFNIVINLRRSHWKMWTLGKVPMIYSSSCYKLSRFR